jgi:hypothetical protein
MYLLIMMEHPVCIIIELSKPAYGLDDGIFKKGFPFSLFTYPEIILLPQKTALTGLFCFSEIT